MKVSEYKAFKDEVINATSKSVVWCYGFQFLRLTEKQAQDLALSTYSMYGKDGVVKYPNGARITLNYDSIKKVRQKYGKI